MAKFYKSKFSAPQQDALLDIVEQGGSGGEGGSDDGWEYYKVDSSFNALPEDELITLGNAITEFSVAYYMGCVSSGSLLPMLNLAYGSKLQGFKVKGEGVYFEIFKSAGLSTFKSLGEEPFASEMNTSALLPFFNALIPCTKEEFESLITK